METGEVKVLKIIKDAFTHIHHISASRKKKNCFDIVWPLMFAGFVMGSSLEQESDSYETTLVVLPFYARNIGLLLVQNDKMNLFN